MTDQPTDDQRRLGGHAVTYQFGQATDAFVHLGTAPGWTPQPVRNALVESSLIHLRSLAGFLLFDPKQQDRHPKTVNDVRPSWYRSGAPWMPGKESEQALRNLHDAVSQTAAHGVIPEGLEHPGRWPTAEALLFVGHELRNFLADSRTDADWFVDDQGHWTLDDRLDQADRLGIVPYQPGGANKQVTKLRLVLRSALGWPNE